MIMNYRTLTFQQIFDLAYMGLASQGWKKATEDGKTQCLHTTTNGMHCAIGWIAPDCFDSNFPARNDKAVFEIAGANPNRLNIIDDLQKAHDHSSSARDMKRKMHEVAEKYKLLIPFELKKRR